MNLEHRAADHTVADTSWRAETARLLRHALPNIGTTVTRMLMTFVDFAMVSRLGTEAQAAVSPSTMLVFITVAFGMAIATTVTAFSAQAYGRRDFREGSTYAWQTVYLAAALTLACPVLARGVPWLFHQLDHPAAVREMEIAYCRIGVWCITPAVVAAGLEGFFNGIQRPVVGLLSNMAALLTNLVGNYALIWGHFGLPAMGIAGASLATLIGWWLRAIILLIVFLRRPTAQRFATRQTWPPDLPRLRQLVAIGAPTSVQWILDIGAWFVFMTVMMGRFGKEAMAAVNTSLQYMHLSFMPAVGISIALCALVGHAIGQEHPDLAVRRVGIALAIVTGYMGLAALLFVSAPRWLMSLFTDDAAVISFGATMLLWSAAFQVWDGVGIVYNNALRGAGDTRWPTVAFVGASWGIFVGGGLAMVRWAPRFGIHGPWAACTLYIVALGLALRWRFRRGRWREIRLFGEKSAGRPAAGDVEPDPGFA